MDNCGKCGCPSGMECNTVTGVCFAPQKCSDGTRYGDCSIIKPKYCNSGVLINNCNVCGCPLGLQCNAADGSCVNLSAQQCPDGTRYYTCSSNKPKYCTGTGALIDNCELCGCPQGKECNRAQGFCFTPGVSICSDGTTYGTCSINKPKYCDNGVLRDNCTLCGCEPKMECNASSGSCFSTLPANCSDGTPLGTCVRGNPPAFCTPGGAIVDDCTMCGCPLRRICNRETGSCFESALPVSIKLTVPKDGEELPSTTHFVYINGTVSNVPSKASISIDDQRFYLKSFDTATGMFSFVNRSVLPEGAITVRVSLKDSEGNEVASVLHSFSLLPTGTQPKGVQWELLIFAAIILLLALLLIYFGQKTLFITPRQAFTLPLQRGDVVLVEGPIGSRKEEFCLSLAKSEISKGKRVVLASFAPEREAALFNEAERKNIIEKKLEPEINEMALMVSEMLESKPDLVYFNIFHELYPKYTAKELSTFVEATIKKLKNAGATALFVLDKDVFSQQELSTLEGLFDGVVEFDVRALPGKVKIFCHVKEFKFRTFNPDWIEYA